MILIFIIFSVAKFEESYAKECIFDYIALHIECQFNKILLLHGHFLAFLPAGIMNQRHFQQQINLISYLLFRSIDYNLNYWQSTRRSPKPIQKLKNCTHYKTSKMACWRTCLTGTTAVNLKINWRRNMRV